MPAWLRRIGDRITWQNPPVEPPADQRTPADRQARIDLLDAEIAGAKAAGDMVLADHLIDLRLAIRPPLPPILPVIPGPAFDDYWGPDLDDYYPEDLR